MEKQLHERFGHAASIMFFQIGNSFNLAHFKKSKFPKIKIPKNDLEALKLDWDSVGREVTIALDKFDNQLFNHRKTNDSTPSKRIQS